jgi:hypothetical protein
MKYDLHVYWLFYKMNEHFPKIDKIFKSIYRGLTGNYTSNMSTTDLESSIKENEESLKEIKELLLFSPEDSELKNLSRELEDLIKLQQEQLLQVKKNELLAHFGLSEEQNKTVRENEYLSM